MSSCNGSAEGLLGTLVTWEEIQRDCFQAFGNTAKLGAKKTIRDISEGKVSF